MAVGDIAPTVPGSKSMGYRITVEREGKEYQLIMTEDETVQILIFWKNLEGMHKLAAVNRFLMTRKI